MAKIVSVKQISSKVKNLKNKVVVGGCFDILHLGHITFLEKAKKKGDYLIVLLESDQTIKKLKGQNRPINTQSNRAKILSKLEMVDLVIPLPVMKNQDYDALINGLHPQVIAITALDSGIEHKKRQAKLVGAKLITVTKKVKGFSSTNLIDLKSV